MTIDDIAKRTGLSRSLVSSVLGGGSSNVGFSEPTRRRVLRAAADLNYKPRIAHGVGVIHSVGKKDPQGVDWVRWISPMLTSIHTEALADHKLVSVFGYASAELDRLLTGGERPPIFKRRRIDGLIISGTLDRELISHLCETGVPYVLMNVSDSDTHAEGSVCFDEVFTGAQATRYLIRKGHQRILHVSVQWSSDHYSVPDRRRGYELAMEEAGLESQTIHHTEDRSDGQVSRCFVSQLKDLLTRPPRPTALFAYNEVVASCCYRVLHELGLTLSDVGLISVAWQETRTMAHLGIAHVELPAFEMGRLAYRALLQKLTTNESVPTISLRGTIKEAYQEG